MVRRATLLTLGALLAATAVGCDRPRSDEAGPDEASRSKAPSASSEPVPAGAQRVAIEATAKGFEPAEVHVERGRPAVLAFTRVVESGCVDAVKMPWRDEPYELPLNKPVNIVIPDTSKAGDFTYSCWMDMVHGKVVIDATTPE